MKVSITGIDLANDVFQVAALNQAGKVVRNRSVRRAKLLDMVRQFEPTILAMEACGSAHWQGTDLIEARGPRSAPFRRRIYVR